MKFLENYSIVRQLLEAVGLSVFHTLWAGCLLLLLLIVILKVIPTHRAKARFTASLLTLQLLFLLFLGVFFYQWNQVAPTPHTVARTITAPLPTTMVLPSAPATTEVNAPPAEAPWLTLLNQWSLWLAMVWLLGGLFHAVRLLLGLQHTRRLRANAQPVSGDWEKRFMKLQRCLGIKQPVMFWQSGQTTVPLTFGWLKPVVLIPAGLLTQLSPEQVEMIVLHELAHIRRYDYLWSLMQSVAEVVLFYHPAYWYIARVLEREREFACDQMTLSVTQQPEIYARTLLQVASTAAPAYGLAVSGKRGLSARIRRIVTPASGQRNIQVLPVLILIGILGLASVTFALQLQQSGSGETSGEQDKPYSKAVIKAYESEIKEITKMVSALRSADSTRIPYASVPYKIYDRAMSLDERLNQYGGKIGFDYSSPTVLYLVDGKVRDPKSVKHSEVVDFEVFHNPERANVKGIDISGYEVIVKAYTEKDSTRSAGLPPTHGADWGAYRRRGFEPSFEEVMGQMPDETLDATSLRLDEIYDSAITIDQRLNRMSLELENSVAFSKSGLPSSSINYSDPEVLYMVDGQVRDPESVKVSEIGMMSISYQPERKKVKGMDMRNYIAVVEVRTKAAMEKPIGQNTTNRADRWLYIVDDQVQPIRPTFLDQDYRADGWKTHIIPAAGWWIKAYLTEEQEASVDENQYTGIVFITSQDYRATQPKHLVHGTVVKKPGELPVPNITVRVKGTNISTTTDAKGHYELAATHWQDTVEFISDDYVTKVPINGMREIGLITTGRSRSKERMQKTLQSIERKLQAKNAGDSVLLTGQVYNWFNNEYVPDIQVVADGSTTTVTDADGRYRFHFPSGTKDVSLTFSAPGYPTHDMEVDMTGKNHFHAVMSMVREDEKATTEDLQTRPAQDSVAERPLIIINGARQYHETLEQLSLDPQDIQSMEVLKEDAAKALLKAWQIGGYNDVVFIKTKKGLVKDEVTNSSKQKSPTQPAQDSVAKNTLVIVDGVPQYDKTWDEVDQELKQNPLYSHYSLSVHGADSSQAILRALRAEEYDRVVRIDSWASKKKNGMIVPTHLESLLHVFPNPTQDWFTLQFSIGEALPITITVLDNQGQPLTTLTNQTYPAGSHEVGWDASNQKSGVYFVQWTMGEQRVTRKVVIE